MISLTTHQKQIELRINFSFAVFERGLHLIGGLLSFTQMREIEKLKQETLDSAGFNYWKI